MAMYSEFEADRDRGNFDKLPELHAVLSGMKVGLSSVTFIACLHVLSTVLRNEIFSCAGLLFAG